MRGIRSTFIFLLAASLIGLIGPACTTLEDNNGSTLTTRDDEQIVEAMFIGGKWDLDGERTNTANGNGEVGAIPSDITKDMFGEGWSFRAEGVLKVDSGPFSETTGMWRIAGKNQLVIQEDVEKNSKVMNFVASFKEGYLYLKNAKGQFMVFERDKFFGM